MCALSGKTKALQSFKLGEEAFPGLQVQPDAQIEDIIRKSLNTIYHAASTCAMGHPDDDNAVVDNHSKVIGVQGLRVVDASAFPNLYRLAIRRLQFVSIVFGPRLGIPVNFIVDAFAEKMACDISGQCEGLLSGRLSTSVPSTN